MRVFIIGGGPSFGEVLKSKELMYLLDNELTIGCNRAFEFVNVDCLTFHDARFGKHWSQEIQEYIDGGGEVYAPMKCKVTGYNRDIIYFKESEELNTSLENGIYTYGNTGTMAISLAVALGFTEIYLLGMDLCFDGDKSHFHDGYRESFNVRARPSHYEHMIRGFNELARLNVNIYNCSPISEIKAFEYVDIKDALGLRCQLT
jgi:hypothetical protein